jgi:histidinol-phosphate aminotransferase
MVNIENLLRENIKRLVPYSSARDEYTGKASIYLDANENAFGSPLPDAWHRYPDPHQQALKEKLSGIKGVPAANIFIGNGSDEVIDLLFRVFCNPGVDNVIICPPTYGMYAVSAATNDVAVRNVLLTAEFQLDLPGIEAATDAHTKIIWLCSPNNPTGNVLHRADVELILNNFPGLVVIDEAYINYSRQRSFIQELTEYPNLVVMQTLSKAWGLAALRVGMAFAGAPVMEALSKVKPPYNVNGASQQLALQALDQVALVNESIRMTVAERARMAAALDTLPIITKVYPSEANFLLVATTDATGIYNFLVEKQIIVRNRHTVILCNNCLRITIGTPDENNTLLQALTAFA